MERGNSEPPAGSRRVASLLEWLTPCQVVHCRQVDSGTGTGQPCRVVIGAGTCGPWLEGRPRFAFVDFAHAEAEHEKVKKRDGNGGLEWEESRLNMTKEGRMFCLEVALQLKCRALKGKAPAPAPWLLLPAWLDQDETLARVLVVRWNLEPFSHPSAAYSASSAI